MYSVKNVIKAMNKEKREERTRNLLLASALSAVAGAAMALFIAPKSDSINNSLNKVKEKVSEVVVTGREKVEELAKEGKVKFEERKNDIKEGADEGKAKFEAIKLDIKKSADELKDATKSINEDMKG